MAQPFVITRSVLDGLAPYIGASLGRLLPLAKASRIEIGEAFEVWSVGVVEGPRALADVAVATGRFHLQVYVGIDGNRPQPAAAVSVVNAEGGWRVVKVADASLARAVDEAIAQIARAASILKGPAITEMLLEQLKSIR